MTENIIGLIVLAIGLIAAARFARTRVRAAKSSTVRTVRRSLPDVRTATPMPPVKPPRPMTRYTQLKGREAVDIRVLKRAAHNKVRSIRHGRAQSWAARQLLQDYPPPPPPPPPPRYFPPQK